MRLPSLSGFSSLEIYEKFQGFSLTVMARKTNKTLGKSVQLDLICSPISDD
jgi:hypothetical protein